MDSVKTPSAHNARRTYCDETGASRQLLGEELHQTAGDLQIATGGLSEAMLPGLIEAQVMRTPAAPAVTFGSQQLSYERLNERANRLARYLIAAGIGPEKLVGIALPRGIDMVVALLAILKSGACYLPLDLEYPTARLAFMQEDAAPELLIATAASRPRLGPTARLVVMDDVETQTAVARHRSDNPDNEDRVSPLHSRLIAYVIYTSGSTGTPKGVMVEYGALTAFCSAISRVLPFGPNDRHLAISSTAFDISILELFVPLCGGAEVIIAGEHQVQDSAVLAQLIKSTRATSIQATPSHWRPLMEQRLSPWPNARLLTGGEPLLRDLAGRLVGTGLSVWNLYGPTEATVWATAHQVKADAVALDPTPIVSLGRALASHSLYVLDRQLMLVPPGVHGELYIGGSALSRGYLKRGGLTAGRFVANPYGNAGERMYRTGDLVRWSATGTLEFIGRADRQVKSRGYRIELDEIEHSLRSQTGVLDAIVITHGEGDQLRLAGYVLVRDHDAESVTSKHVKHPDRYDFGLALRDNLEAVLPSYMVPSAITVMSKWPLTPNGKIDRAALPAPLFGQSMGIREPRTPTEERISAIFSDVLGVDRIGIDDDFFNMGGHSLLAMRVVARIQAEFGLSISIRHFFEQPTIAAITERVVQGSGATEVEAFLPIEHAPAQYPPSLSIAQEGYLVRRFFRISPGEALLSSTISMTVNLSGQLNVMALERALNEIVHRHEVLRTRVAPTRAARVLQMIIAVGIDLRESKVARGLFLLGFGFRLNCRIFRQELARDAPLTLRIADLSGFHAARQALVSSELAELGVPFDLKKPPLLRAALLKLDEDEHMLCVSAARTAFDESSETILRSELAALYEGFAHKKQSSLGELPIQYSDFAAWERNQSVKQRTAHLADALISSPRISPLRAAQLSFHRRATEPTYLASTAALTVDTALYQEIKQVCAQNKTTIFDFFLATLDVLLSRASGNAHVDVWTGLTNRTRPEVQDLIGLFTRWHLMSVDLSGDPAFSDVLRRVAAFTRLALADRQASGSYVASVEGIKTSDATRECSQYVAFHFKTEMEQVPNLGKTSILMSERWGDRSDLSDYALKVMATERRAGVTLLVRYSVDWFTDQSILEMLHAFRLLIADIVAGPSRPISALCVRSQ